MKNGLFAGLVIGFLLAGCTAASLYPYYAMDLPDGCYKDGKLLAHEPKDDKSMSLCQPNGNNKMPCVVRQSADDERLMLDLSKCQTDLKACQGVQGITQP